MAHEPGDDYIRRIASFVRTNEQGLAQGGFTRRRRPRKPAEPAASALNPLSWLAPAADTAPAPVKPVTFTTDTHRLFYLMIRMEALGLPVGSLDVRVDNPARPLSYINYFPSEKSDAISLSSFRSSFSAVSNLSLGGSWWGRPPPPTLDEDLKYIYSSFTKLPALSLHGPGPKMIAEAAAEPNTDSALPLDAFKNLQAFECLDVDPRTLLGWDKLSVSLESLTIKRSGLEDVSDIFIGAVLDDQARREGSASRSRTRRIASYSRKGSFTSTPLPESVHEEEEEDSAATPTGQDSPTPPAKLSSLQWAFLKHLCLADNALTFIPTAPLPYLVSLTHLDLSSNLLVSVPPGLSALYNLVSLNLSDNMIDSVLGIYTQPGQILYLNLARNRLESLCGLERLMALERVDVRHNVLEESAEVGRLATLPNIAEVWVEGNPFTEIEEAYRVRCFDHFWKEGKEIIVDGTTAGYYERRYMRSPPPEQMSSSRPLSIAASPPVVAVGTPSRLHTATPSSADATPRTSPPSSQQPSPHLAAVGVGPGRGRRKKNKRIVDLNAEGGESGEDGRSRSASRHARMLSDGGVSSRTLSPDARAVRASPRKKIVDLGADVSSPRAVAIAPKARSKPATPIPSPPRAELPAAFAARTPLKTRHSRYQTEFAPFSAAVASGSGSLSSSPAKESALASSSATPSPSAPAPISSVMAPTPFSSTHRRSATLSGKAKTRRGRVSASVFEPAPAEDRAGAAPEGPESETRRQIREAEAYRARIEALRTEVGDGWLKVFSQSGLGSPSPPTPGSAPRTAGIAQG